MFAAWKKISADKNKDNKQNQYCEKFFNQGLINKSWKSWKLYMQVLGNRMYEKKLKDKVNT